METEEEQAIVLLPHFTSEEVEALQREHERREELFKGRGLFDNDEERVRDAHQRESYWCTQLNHLVELGLEQSEDTRHAEEELGHALFIQGRIDEALALTESPERRAHYLSIHAAIVKDDGETCECPKEIEVEFIAADGEKRKAVDATTHTVGKMPSFKHGGRMMPIKRCVLCGDTNIG